MTDPTYTPRPQAWYTRHPSDGEAWGVECIDHGEIATGLDKLEALVAADRHAREEHGVNQPVKP